MGSQQVLFIVLLFFSNYLLAQESFCPKEASSHQLESIFLEETRDYWVSLPHGYSDSLRYPVIYVFDAEWRFDLIRNIAFDWGANGKIQNAIVVGIPHVEMEKKRGQDLTFSHSRIEYDGDAVDSVWYNASNSGGGMKFYKYLTEELIPDVSRNYSINHHETLIGHSYGGYFGAYILSMHHPFEVIHIYDPSAWYSNGEITERFKISKSEKEVKVYLTYQGEPTFHREKIEEFVVEIRKAKNISITTKFYPDETHNSLFLDSFYRGIEITNR